MNANALPQEQSGRHARRATCSLALLSLLCSVALFAQSSQSSPTVTTNTSSLITIRDGTPIHLRFAERVCGAAPGLNAVAVKKGAAVKLVVTRDLRAGSKILIAKGSRAQATVDRVLPSKPSDRRRRYDPVFPGVSLQFDWVTSVTGDRAPLRIGRKPPAKSSDVFVELSDSGADVRPSPISKGLNAFFWRTEKAFTFAPSTFSSEKPVDVCIPDGARMLAYLDGDFKLAEADVAAAQSSLPPPGSDAILNLFRLKEKKNESDVAPSVFCNQLEIPALAPQQMAITNLPPGNYSCRIGDQPPIEIGLQGGYDYYAQLHRGRHDKWVLWWFTPEEGEDLGADTQVVQPKATGPNP